MNFFFPFLLLIAGIILLKWQSIKRFIEAKAKQNTSKTKKLTTTSTKVLEVLGSILWWMLKRITPIRLFYTFAIFFPVWILYDAVNKTTKATINMTGENTGIAVISKALQNTNNMIPIITLCVIISLVIGLVINIKYSTEE